MSHEPWKTEAKKLRRVFEITLESIWNRWIDWELKGTPFGDLEEVTEHTSLSTREIIDFSFEGGWTRGVSEAEGWSLRRPGPREWSPRG